MMILNDELFEELIPYERILNTAYYGMYLIGADTAKINAIGNIALRAGYNNSVNPTCSVCRLRLCKDVGKVYFEYKALKDAETVECTTKTKKTPRKANKQQKKGK